jgi:hypothetical protein
MFTRTSLPALALLTLLVSQAPAQDLGKVERVIAKEPAYKGKPRYCLLVFGPDARTRVWLVQDGDTLYVDRDGSGDLTRPDAKVMAEKRDDAEPGAYTFQIPEIRDGSRLHKNLYVGTANIEYLASQDDRVKALLAKDTQARGYYVVIDVEMPGWKGTGLGGRGRQRAFYVDAAGVLQFADTPQAAPIIHFGGPWQVTLWGRNQLTIGRETDVFLGVGTPGVGPGTTAWIDYDRVIPEDVYPTLTVTYPPKAPGEPLVQERYELKHRC